MKRAVTEDVHAPARSLWLLEYEYLSSNLRLSLNLTFQVLGHVSERIADLHAAGFAHRDLKPGNIMWQPRTYTWVLIDFGLAATIGEQAAVGFTPTYAAPEMVIAFKAGEKYCAADAAVDAWALGIIAFELLLERPAFGRFVNMPDVSAPFLVFNHCPLRDEVHLSRSSFCCKS